MVDIEATLKPVTLRVCPAWCGLAYMPFWTPCSALPSADHTDAMKGRPSGVAASQQADVFAGC